MGSGAVLGLVRFRLFLVLLKVARVDKPAFVVGVGVSKPNFDSLFPLLLGGVGAGGGRGCKSTIIAPLSLIPRIFFGVCVCSGRHRATHYFLENSYFFRGYFFRRR